MSLLCCKPISLRVISPVHVGQLLTLKPKEPTPRIDHHQGRRGVGAAELPLTRLPFIWHASDGRRVGAVTLDVSASRCVGESSTCRERESGAENNRSGKHDFSDREHCLFLSVQSAVFSR